MTKSGLKADAVFEGGGVKGIGLVGAVAATEAEGYEFQNLAGTSAGAIVATLLAAGYGAAALREIIEGIDYRRFRDCSPLHRVPYIGPTVNLLTDMGMYEGDYFERWMRQLLLDAPGGPVAMFADLNTGFTDPRRRWRLQLIATDVSRGRMLVLPGDIRDYGLHPDNLDVARAVRMSMSYPYFFEPVRLRDAFGRHCYIVDGGVLSNFPVWLFDEPGSEPHWPAFGYRIIRTHGPRHYHPIREPVSLIKAMVLTMIEAADDERYVRASSCVRTINIPSLDVSSLEFNLCARKRRHLYEAGYDTAKRFFRHWDFDRYKEIAGIEARLRQRRSDWRDEPAVHD